MGSFACLAEGVARRWRLAQYVQGEPRRPASEDREDEKGVGRDDITGVAGWNHILEGLSIHSENFAFYDVEVSGKPLEVLSRGNRPSKWKGKL